MNQHREKWQKSSSHKHEHLLSPPMLSKWCASTVIPCRRCALWDCHKCSSLSSGSWFPRCKLAGSMSDQDNFESYALPMVPCLSDTPRLVNMKICYLLSLLQLWHLGKKFPACTAQVSHSRQAEQMEGTLSACRIFCFLYYRSVGSSSSVAKLKIWVAHLKVKAS